MFRLLSGVCLSLLLMSFLVGCGNNLPPTQPIKSDGLTKSDGQRKGDGSVKVKENGKRSTTSKKAKKGTATATIKVLFPADEDTTTTLKVEGKEVEIDEDAAKEGVHKVVVPGLEKGKTYTYKVEATIEPNNYTKIVRTRQVTFKAGDEVTLDVRKKDSKIPDNVIIRWVPTPRIVAEDMCKLAKVGPSDVVMDPGCGDAVMLIAAVEKFKAKRAKGTDLDPEKVEESRNNVEKAGLKDKITIKEGNALKLTADDLKDVTVVMLYMGDELNVRLRPLLWKYLPVGARVVSHRFLMGDWAPDKSITVNRDGHYGNEDFDLHVWTITGKEKTGEYKRAEKRLDDD